MVDDLAYAPSLASLSARADALAEAGQADGRRRILGIVGPPGSGKSTLAQALVAQVEGAVNVPMDGFHLAGSELVRLGRADRKGAPDTFDAGGYVALLHRLRSGAAESDDAVYAPEFRREIEEPVAGAIRIGPAQPLVVTEGNYLLLDDAGWAPVRDLLDEVWFVDMDEQLRLTQLVERHVRFGKAPEEAYAWAHSTDQRNADLVAATRGRADLVVRLSADPA